MGKKKVARKQGGEMDQGLKSRSLARVPKKKIASGVLHIHATYNNTKVSLADSKGNIAVWTSTGSLGFKGAKKGTPFAAAKAAEVIADKAEQMGVKEVAVIVKGVGSGRESAIRAFGSRGINIISIKDTTPVPHNGVRPPKPRRV